MLRISGAYAPLDTPDVSPSLRTEYARRRARRLAAEGAHEPAHVYLGEVGGIRYYRPGCSCGWSETTRSERATEAAHQRHLVLLDEGGRLERAGDPRPGAFEVPDPPPKRWRSKTSAVHPYDWMKMPIGSEEYLAYLDEVPMVPGRGDTLTVPHPYQKNFDNVFCRWCQAGKGAPCHDERLLHEGCRGFGTINGIECRGCGGRGLSPKVGSGRRVLGQDGGGDGGGDGAASASGGDGESTESGTGEPGGEEQGPSLDGSAEPKSCPSCGAACYSLHDYWSCVRCGWAYPRPPRRRRRRQRVGSWFDRVTSPTSQEAQRGGFEGEEGGVEPRLPPLYERGEQAWSDQELERWRSRPRPAELLSAPKTSTIADSQTESATPPGLPRCDCWGIGWWGCRETRDHEYGRCTQPGDYVRGVSHCNHCPGVVHYCRGCGLGVPKLIREYSGKSWHFQLLCSSCRGLGEIGGVECRGCGGTGESPIEPGGHLAKVVRVCDGYDRALQRGGSATPPGLPRCDCWGTSWRGDPCSGCRETRDHEDGRCTQPGDYVRGVHHCNHFPGVVHYCRGCGLGVPKLLRECPSGKPWHFQLLCPSCRGLGEIGGVECRGCGGTGESPISAPKTSTITDSQTEWAMPPGLPRCDCWGIGWRGSPCSGCRETREHGRCTQPGDYVRGVNHCPSGVVYYCRGCGLGAPKRAKSWHFQLLCPSCRGLGEIGGIGCRGCGGTGESPIEPGGHLAKVVRVCDGCGRAFDWSEDGRPTGLCGTCRERAGVVRHEGDTIEQSGHYGAAPTSRWVRGLCGEYAVALVREYPSLRIGMHRLHYGEDEEGEDRGYGIHHVFAHDDRYAYDYLGRYPLPYDEEALRARGSLVASDMGGERIEDVYDLSMADLEAEWGQVDPSEVRAARKYIQEHAILTPNRFPKVGGTDHPKEVGYGRGAASFLWHALERGGGVRRIAEEGPPWERPREGEGARASAQEGDGEAPLMLHWAAPTVEDAIEVNRAILEEMGQPNGGQLRDRVALESALARLSNSLAYGGDAAQAAARLAHGIGQAQAFEDGNKRTAHALAAMWLEDAGYGHLVEGDDEELADHLIGYGEGTHAADHTAELLRRRARRRRGAWRAVGSEVEREASKSVGSRRNVQAEQEARGGLSEEEEAAAQEDFAARLRGAAPKTAIVAVGVPGSGKTTVLRPLAERRGAGYVSTDAIRAELTGDEADVSRDSEVWPLAYARMHEALDRGDVVVDATSASAPHRRQLIEHLRQKADRVEAVWFDVPLEVALERNRSRSRVVPEEIIKKMHGQLAEDPPSEDEGFDSVTRIEGGGERVGATSGLWSELNRPSTRDRYGQREAGAKGPFPEDTTFRHESEPLGEAGAILHRVTAYGGGDSYRGHIEWLDAPEGTCTRCAHRDEEHDDLGCLGDCFCEEEGGWASVPFVRGIQVHPKWQRRGIATRLWEEAHKVQPDLDHDPNERVITDEGRAWIEGMEASDEDRELMREWDAEGNPMDFQEWKRLRGAAQDVPGILYLLHFERPIADAPIERDPSGRWLSGHSTQHYLGWSKPGGLEARLEAHRRGQGARLTQVAAERGIGFELARTWEGVSRHFERQVKGWKMGPRLCPTCALARAPQPVR